MHRTHLFGHRSSYFVFSMTYFGALWVLYRLYPPKLSDLELGATCLFYPTAIRQLMTGIYFMEICLAGLFFLVRDADGNATLHKR